MSDIVTQSTFFRRLVLFPSNNLALLSLRLAQYKTPEKAQKDPQGLWSAQASTINQSG
jgi:hypothetical protein